MDIQMKIEELNMEPRELAIDELDNASGGFIYIPVVVGAFLLGTGIRMGIDWAVGQIFG